MNLHTIEKVYEEHIKRQLTKYLLENDIIHDSHHGGMANRSTNTVKALIDWHINSGYERDKTSVIISTDLSSCFDTVDHCILVRKMHYYGIRNKELDLFISYLKDRMQYVECDTFRSEVMIMPDCSVVQGGKLSCLLYTIYTNEVPSLYKVMKDDHLMMELTGKINMIKDGVTHNIYCYMDNSKSCIVFKDASKLQEYIDNFFEVLKEYHNLSKLKLNEDKCMLLILLQPKHQHKYKEVKLEDKEKKHYCKIELSNSNPMLPH